MVERPKVVRVDKIIEKALIIEEAKELVNVNAALELAECETEDEIIEEIKDADVILTMSAQITRRVMEASPKLKAIVRYGVGYDTIDVTAATDHSILVINLPGYNTKEVANHAFALLLACARRLIHLHTLAKGGKWAKDSEMSPIMPIYGQTLGLIGCGRIGQLVAKKASCFELTVLGYDPYIDKTKAEVSGITLVSMPELLKASDYISIHTSLSHDNWHLLGETEFKQMKPSAYLINTSRGSVIDEPALIKALKEKWIAGAGLDVFEEEPIAPDNPLLIMDNVVITPHCAGNSYTSRKLRRRMVGQEAARVLSGRWPKNVVNKDVKPKINLAEID